MQQAVAKPIVNLKPAKAKIESLGLDVQQLEKEGLYALRSLGNNPQLIKCTEQSIAYAIVDCVSMGLTLDPSKQFGYLEPRFSKEQKKTICHFQPMYRGLAYLAAKEGAVTSIRCQVVRKNDTFKAVPSDPMNPVIHEFESFERGDIVGCYSLCGLPDGTYSAEFIGLSELREILSVSKSPAYKKYPGEFYRKTTFKRHVKRLMFGASNSPLLNAVMHDNHIYQDDEKDTKAEAAQIDDRPIVERGSQLWINTVKGLAQGHGWEDIEAVYNVPQELKADLQKEANEYYKAQ